MICFFQPAFTTEEALIELADMRNTFCPSENVYNR